MINNGSVKLYITPYFYHVSDKKLRQKWQNVFKTLDLLTKRHQNGQDIPYIQEVYQYSHSHEVVNKYDNQLDNKEDELNGFLMTSFFDTKLYSWSHLAQRNVLVEKARSSDIHCSFRNSQSSRTCLIKHLRITESKTIVKDFSSPKNALT